MLASSAGLTGLLALVPLTPDNIGMAVIYVLSLIMCVAVHEFGHAWVADHFGDPVPRAQGRVTLNPLAHIDLLGTVIFPAMMALGVGIPLGWGKPVEWSGHPRFLTRRYSMRTIRLLVSVAGPAMNLLLALALSLVFLGLVHFDGGFLAVLIGRLIIMNLGLMVFNLVPVPPLDGRSFLEYLPRSLAPVRDVLMQYGSFIFLALLFTGAFGYILAPFYGLIYHYIEFLARLAS